MLKDWSQRLELPTARAGWPKVPSSQHSQPSLVPTLQPGTPGAAGASPGGNTRLCLQAMAHQVYSGVMHSANSDILHSCWDPDLVEVSLSSACSHEIIIVMGFRKRLNIHAVKKHFPVLLTGTDTAAAINLHVPGWKLIMGWSHCLPPFPRVGLCNHHPCSSSEVRGEGVTFLWSIRHHSGHWQDAAWGGHGRGPAWQVLPALLWVPTADAARCHLWPGSPLPHAHVPGLPTPSTFLSSWGVNSSGNFFPECRSASYRHWSEFIAIAFQEFVVLSIQGLHDAITSRQARGCGCKIA